MQTVQIHYRPATGATGPTGVPAQAWWVAAEGRSLAVLDPAAGQATAVAVWRRLADGGIGGVLDALTGAFGTSLAAIPPFALAIAEPGGVRVAVRGPLTLIVDSPSGPQEITGSGVATWVETLVADAVTVTATRTTAGGDRPGVPLRSGVVVADAVAAEFGGRATVPAAGAASRLSPPLTPPAADPVDTPAADLPIEPVAAVAPLEPSEPSAPVEPSEPSAPVELSEPLEPSADTWLPEATDAGGELPDEYDLLWGETVARPVAAAASEVDDGVEVADADAHAGEPAPSPDLPTMTSVPASPAGDHDGQTISVAEARAARAAQRERFESTENVPPRRPERGRVVLSTGRVVELERPVIVGRRPKATRTSGADLPTLVAVDSPEQDISRSHVEIRAEGEHVLVTDLDTTNGTVLHRGGTDPIRLHPGEPTMVVTGDVLDIGEGVTMTFEDLP